MPEGRMSLREFLNQDVGELFGRRAGEGTPAESIRSASSPQARLEITRSASKLEFLCTNPRMRFFSLDAYLSGNLEMSRSMSEDKIPTTRVEIPLEGQKNNMVLLFCSEEGEQSWPLTEAAVVALQDGSRALHFAFGDDKDRILYKFIMPSDLEVADFQPVERQQQSTYMPPSVAQLGAMLRTTLKDRRDSVSVLEDLGSALGAATVSRVAQLRKTLPSRASLQTPGATLLVDHLTGQMEDGKRPPNPQLLSALCLLLDIETQMVSDADLAAFARGERPLRTSFPALVTVGAFYGATLAPSEWKTRLEQSGAGFLAGDSAVQASMAVAMKMLAERMGRPRDALQVITNLVRESPSPRVDAMVKLWTARRQSTPGDIEGLQALSDLVSACSRRMDPGTLGAFCLYAEIESGCCGEERFIAWVEGKRTLVLSPYTMQAVATALDIPLVGFTLPAQQRKMEFGALFALSPGGVMQGLASTDGVHRTYRFLAEASSASEEVEGWRPCGDVMLRTSMLERLTERELNMFLRLGNRFYACFQSDLDRRRVWKLLDDSILKTDNPYTFIEGFRVYHFQGSVLAEIRPAAEQEQSSGTSPLICKDHRNSLNFFHPEEPPPPGGVMREAGLIVHFPPTDQLPPMMSEMGTEDLLGRIEAGGNDVRKLEMLRSGLSSIVRVREDTGPAVNARGLQHLREKLDSARVQQTLRQVVDQRTLDVLVSTYMGTENPPFELSLYEPVIKGLRDDELLEFTALALIYELCISEVTTIRGFHKNYKKTVFRAALRNHLLHILDADNASVRAIGCRLLCTGPCIGDASERSIVEYELLRRLEDPDDAVAQEAGAALARIALEEELGLPAIWQLRKRAPSGPEAALNDKNRMMLNVAQEIRNWQTRLSAMLIGSTAVQPVPTATSRLGLSPAAPTGGLREIAAFIAGVRIALGRQVERGSLMVVLTSVKALDTMLHEFLETFAAYGDASLLGMDGVVKEISARGLGGYLNFMAGVDSGELRRLDDTEDETSFETFRFDAVCKPSPLWIERDGGGSQRVSPLFMAILRRALEGSVDQIRLALLPEAGSPAARVSSGETRGSVLPVPLRMHVYNSARDAFVPLVEEMLPTAQFSYSTAEQQLLAALVEARPSVATAEPEVEMREAPRVEAGDGATSTPQPIVIEQEKPEVVLRARRFLDAFALPQTYLMQMLYVFQEIRPLSVYDFF